MSATLPVRPATDRDIPAWQRHLRAGVERRLGALRHGGLRLVETWAGRRRTLGAGAPGASGVMAAVAVTDGVSAHARPICIAKGSSARAARAATKPSGATAATWAGAPEISR